MANKYGTCLKCGKQVLLYTDGKFHDNSFLPMKNKIAGINYYPVCYKCLGEELKREMQYRHKWDVIDSLCQLLDIKFDLEIWERLERAYGDETYIEYCNLMTSDNYETISWKEVNDEYKKMQDKKQLVELIPEARAMKLEKLREKWGMNYDEESVVYLENLYVGILNSQNVNGDLQVDNAKKLCKIALLIDERLRAGEDFDKLLTSYDKLTKIADFTPRNAKNVNDFDSVGELMAWLEKRGWSPIYYTGKDNDIVDKTITNMQAYTRNLYINESGIEEEIERKIEALKHMHDLEYSQTEVNVDYDVYEKEAKDMALDFEDEEFEEDY